MNYLSLLIAAFALALGACESHSWEDVKDEKGEVIEKGTKRLYESHQGHDGDQGKHGEGEGTGHDQDKGEPAGEGEGHDKDKAEADH